MARVPVFDVLGPRRADQDRDGSESRRSERPGVGPRDFFSRPAGPAPY